MFPHVPVTSSEDSTLNFHTLEGIITALEARLKKIEEQLATKK